MPRSTAFEFRAISIQPLNVVVLFTRSSSSTAFAVCAEASRGGVKNTRPFLGASESPADVSHTPKPSSRVPSVARDLTEGKGVFAPSVGAPLNVVAHVLGVLESSYVVVPTTIAAVSGPKYRTLSVEPYTSQCVSSSLRLAGFAIRAAVPAPDGVKLTEGPSSDRCRVTPPTCRVKAIR